MSVDDRGRAGVPVDRRGARPPPGGVPRRHHLEDPLPREPGPARPRAHAVGLPQVLRDRRRAAALDPAPAAGALPAAEGHQGPPARRRPTPGRRCRPTSRRGARRPSAVAVETDAGRGRRRGPSRRRRSRRGRAAGAGARRARRRDGAAPARRAAPRRHARPRVGADRRSTRSTPGRPGSASPLDELAAASRPRRPPSSSELERFGLLAGRTRSAARRYYDEDALIVARTGGRLPAATASRPATCACTRSPPSGRPASSSRSSCRCSSSATRRPAGRPPRPWPSWPSWARGCGPRCCASALRDHTELTLSRRRRTSRRHG